MRREINGLQIFGYLEGGYVYRTYSHCVNTHAETCCLNKYMSYLLIKKIYIPELIVPIDIKLKAHKVF